MKTRGPDQQLRNPTGLRGEEGASAPFSLYQQPDLAPPRSEAPRTDSAGSQRIEDALHESERKYRNLYDHIPLMYFQLDEEGKVLSVNDHGARELGYASCDLMGQSVLQVFHPEDRQKAAMHLQWALEGPDEVSRWELRKVRKDGTVLWVRETVRISRADGGPPTVLVICEDVTEHRLALEQIGLYRDRLRALNAELLRVKECEQRRIARVLHDELGQTLAAARMTVCGLREEETSPRRTKRLDELRAGLAQSIEVTRSLTFQLSPPILHDLGLVAALQALGEKTERDHGIRFVFAVADGWSPPSEEARIALYRVVRELLHNVAKHARADSVKLELDGLDDRTRIRLEDDGVGFDAATTGQGSRCLGLFHVREQVERMGGCFEIDSSPGHGTRAVLSLPAGDLPRVDLLAAELPAVRLPAATGSDGRHFR